VLPVDKFVRSIAMDNCFH